MKQQIINISGFEYLIEFYNSNNNKDILDIKYKEYYILRNVSFLDGVAYDTDIYFIEKDIFEAIKESNNTITDKVVFPCYNSKFGPFSQSYTDFSNILNKHSFKLDTDGGNVFSLFTIKKSKYVDNKPTVFERKNIKLKCDKIRIYHPHNQNDLKYIIYLDNIINGIHFHYFCNYNINCKISSETEKVINNNKYSEFVEIYVPNMEFLFNEFSETKYYNQNSNNNEDLEYTIDNNVYFNDIYNITKYIDVENYTLNSTDDNDENWISVNSNKIKTLNDNVGDEPETLSYVPFNLLLNPFIIYKNELGLSEKVYYKMSNYDCNNFNSLPINITLYPYQKSEINNMLLTNDNYIANSETFTTDHYFNLISKIGFEHNKLCIVNTFNYINSQELTLAEAYAKYNGLSKPIWAYEENNHIIECVTDEDMLREDKFQISKEYIIFKRKKQKIIDDFNINKPNKYAEIELDEIEEDIPIYCCGYQIDIASDMAFSNIIASDYIETPFIEDFDFSLVNLFNDWYSIPNLIIIRIKYIDKYLGITLMSGFIIMSKEWLKYSINDTNTSRLYINFKNKQNDLSDMGNWKNKIDANETVFNFIDKINCIVDKKHNNDINIYGNNNIKIIYKPIFYRTQDLQNISIKNGLKQKIGINLSSYMTKVNAFKLVIDNKEFIEFGRNDIYVIFEINAGLLTQTTGVYNILDSSDNYISSGNWYTV